mmetsp:Transcript_54578/g.145761  ORF Transcript_54578/g.145761 Transcript_54578/m.145761 type:complete len:587 (+) Transcript_54578:568-2328(+)
MVAGDRPQLVEPTSSRAQLPLARAWVQRRICQCWQHPVPTTERACGNGLVGGHRRGQLAVAMVTLVRGREGQQLGGYRTVLTLQSNRPTCRDATRKTNLNLRAEGFESKELPRFEGVVQLEIHGFLLSIMDPAARRRRGSLASPRRFFPDQCQLGALRVAPGGLVHLPHEVRSGIFQQRQVLRRAPGNAGRFLFTVLGVHRVFFGIIFVRSHRSSPPTGNAAILGRLVYLVSEGAKVSERRSHRPWRAVPVLRNGFLGTGGGRATPRRPWYVGAETFRFGEGHRRRLIAVSRLRESLETSGVELLARRATSVEVLASCGQGRNIHDCGKDLLTIRCPIVDSERDGFDVGFALSVGAEGPCIEDVFVNPIKQKTLVFLAQHPHGTLVALIVHHHQHFDRCVREEPLAFCEQMRDFRQLSCAIHCTDEDAGSLCRHVSSPHHPVHPSQICGPRLSGVEINVPKTATPARRIEHLEVAILVYRPPSECEEIFEICLHTVQDSLQRRPAHVKGVCPSLDAETLQGPRRNWRAPQADELAAMHEFLYQRLIQTVTRLSLSLGFNAYPSGRVHFVTVAKSFHADIPTTFEHR